MTALDVFSDYWIFGLSGLWTTGLLGLYCIVSLSSLNKILIILDIPRGKKKTQKKHFSY